MYICIYVYMIVIHNIHISMYICMHMSSCMCICVTPLATHPPWYWHAIFRCLELYIRFIMNFIRIVISSHPPFVPFFLPVAWSSSWTRTELELPRFPPEKRNKSLFRIELELTPLHHNPYHFLPHVTQELKASMGTSKDIEVRTKLEIISLGAINWRDYDYPKIVIN